MSAFRLLRRLSTSALAESWAGVEVVTVGPPSRQVVQLKRLAVPLAALAPRAESLRELFEQTKQMGFEGVVPLAEIGVGAGAAWLVEDNLETESLRSLLAALASDKGRLAPNEGFAVLLQLAEVLAELHAAEPGFPHGDLCASTVSLTPGGAVRLTEPGVAMRLGDSAAGPWRAEAQSLSPDQLNGAPGVAADVFRLGLVLHELALGRPLFQTSDGAQGLALMRSYTGLTAAAIPSVPEPFASLLTKLLAVDPRERPSARDAQMLLEQATRRLNWAVGPAVVAALFSRAFPSRALLSTLWNQSGEELVLRPLTMAALSEAPVSAPRGRPGTNPLGILAPPPAPSAPVRTPPPIPPVSQLTPVPAGPLLSSASQVSLARIATRRVSLSEFRSLQAADAPVAPPAAVPESTPSGGIKDFRVGEHLVTNGKLTRAKLEEAIAYARDFNVSLPDALVAIAAVEEDEMIAALGEATRTPTITGKRLDDMPPSADALRLISPEDANLLCAVPLSLKGSTQLVVALRDPMDEGLIRELKQLTGLASIVAIRAGEQGIRRTISRFYGTPLASALPSWLDATAGGAGAAQAPAAPPTRRPPTQELPLRPPLERPPPASRAVAPPGSSQQRDPSRPLVEALLGSLGERGKEGRALLQVLGGVCGRLALKEAEASRLWLAGAAVVVSNTVNGRRAFDLSQLGAVGTLVGGGWAELAPLVLPAVDQRRPPVSNLSAASFLATFHLAILTGHCPPSPVEALPVLEPLRPRLPAMVIEAVLAELQSC